MSRAAAFVAIARRELDTIVRTRSYLALTVGLAVILSGIVAGSDALQGGYVPTAVDLLLPLELLVPTVSVVLGYRAFTGENDDLSILRTYPVSTVLLTAGVFVGRAIALVAILGVPLATVAVLVAVTPGVESAVFVTHSGVDSPALFVRFATLTVVFGVVVLSLALAVAALARRSRTALALALLVFLGVVAGGDLLVLSRLGGPGTTVDLASLLAVSPNSAYRGLVFETVIGVATADSGFANPTLNVVGLVGWLAVGLLTTGLALAARSWNPQFVATWKAWLRNRLPTTEN